MERLTGWNRVEGWGEAGWKSCIAPRPPNTIIFVVIGFPTLICTRVQISNLGHEP